MAECTLPMRDQHAPDVTEAIPIFTVVAREWALATGYATVVDGDLRPTRHVDTIGETVVTIGNSERSVENFALVHKIIAHANKGGVTVAHSVLANMVETADFMFGPMKDLPESTGPATA